MSWHRYPTLTAQPDFTNPATSGMVDERIQHAFSNDRTFLAWPDRTDRIFGFTFQGFEQVEWRYLREFFDARGGRAKGFFLPTWSQDFDLAADAPAGATTLTVAGHHHSGTMTENRPDTPGRKIFTVSHAGAFEHHWVVEATASGDNDTLTLDSPTANAMEAGRTMVGFCHLARLADDTISSTHASPDHTETALTFRTVQHRRALDQFEPAVTAVVGTMKPAADVTTTDADPLYTDFRYAEATGPIIRGVPQAEYYDSLWTATLDQAANTVRLVGPFGYSALLTAYTAPAPAVQIALTFDALSNPILAWELGEGITIAWQSGGAGESVTFDGHTPVAYNTFAIDGLSNAGTSTAAVFYLKDDDATIYARIAAEDFATEHRYCVSPFAPLGLHAAIRFDARLEIVGMDTMHRLARWRSTPYQTPPQVESVTGSIVEISGLYRESTVRAPNEETATADIVAITGTYIYIPPPGPVLINDTETASATLVSISGAYVSTTRPAAASDAASGTVVSLTGIYFLAKKDGPATTGATATIASITGTYATP